MTRKLKIMKNEKHLYSWKNGTEKRYGLVAVDYEGGLERKPKKSYYWFRDVIRSQGKLINRQKYKEEGR